MSEVSGLKSVVGTKQTKEYKFMGTKLILTKLTVSQVLEIQELSKISEKEDLKERDAFDSIKTVIRMSVQDSDDMEDDDFNELPLDELIKLSQEIMRFSGIADTEGK